MKHTKYLILGAGPSGLSLAHSLLKRGEPSVLVIEKEQTAGGLCRSENVDGSPLDIGGGHFLDVRKQEVLDLLFSFLPGSEWNKYSRISKILFGEAYMDYPFESHIWQLSTDEQISFLKSIALAGSNLGEEMPTDFKKWISWKLGDKIANEYMLPYNQKIWSMDLDRLGTYWLYKLPNVSFEETLRSCLERSLSGTLPAHASFYYPKHYGYGEVWRRMGDALGNKLMTAYQLKSVDLKNRIINEEIQADIIISTIPWQSYLDITDLPSELVRLVSSLEYSSIRVEYVKDNVDTDAHWVYIPDTNVTYHRQLCRSNFATGSRGHWTETNAKRAQHTDNWYHDNHYAYPLNTKGKPDTIKNILNWFRQSKIIGLGRWGRWEHMNSDVAVQEAIDLSREI